MARPMSWWFPIQMPLLISSIVLQPRHRRGVHPATHLRKMILSMKVHPQTNSLGSASNDSVFIRHKSKVVIPLVELPPSWTDCAAKSNWSNSPLIGLLRHFRLFPQLAGSVVDTSRLLPDNAIARSKRQVHPPMWCRISGAHSFVTSPTINIPALASGFFLAADDQLLNQSVGVFPGSCSQNQSTWISKTTNSTVPK